MEDKTYELLKRMYDEFIGFKDETTGRFGGLLGELRSLEESLTHLDNGLKPMLDALITEQKKILVTGDRIIGKLSALDDKLTDRRRKVQLTVLKGGNQEAR